MAIILITGSSSGIGFATAALLARSGHKVYASMRNPDSSPQLQVLAAQENLPITVIPLDVNDDQSVEKGIHQVLTSEGYIDVLINNAGIASISAVEESPMEMFKAMMETNYFGTIRCIKAVLPSMRQRQSGHIINVSSVAGKLFSNFHAPYCASKAAVEALSESLAQEVIPFHIKVSVVEPGVIETPIFEKSETVTKNTKYPNIHRFMAFFAASLDNHVQAEVVGEVIQHIVEGDAQQFRYAAGHDAQPLMGWRSSLSDEDWINSVNVDQETWANGMKEGLHLNVMAYLDQPTYH